ncbi:myosin light chain kinase smooth muscle [Clonorchis sinensis]|uniref:Myosin light chain kinase smooth muscle n=2 Tax=Clonorchis sinensis TaxID=79923 RepID=H2KUH9_CLOSI|nr:myosin light chain kinase smooth muscle [Clonorchis sinensis]
MFSRVSFKTNSVNEDDEDTDPKLLKKNVTIKENTQFTRDYKIGEYLGSGKFGEVKRCEEIRTGSAFAAKFVPIAHKDDWESVQNEVAIMNKLRHPRLIQLYDAYAIKSEVVLVLELITGGELFERIIDEDFDLNETRCIRFMNEILQGVEYIHNQGVLHLDLKPENILCLSKTSFKIKIIDFGLARFYGESDVRVLFGTPEFVSPEVISYEPVTPAADMWSVGVICYVMLSGLSPFMGDSQGETLANIIRVKYDFEYQEFEEISEGARDFIRMLLIKDPRKRMTASDCLQHSWIKRKKQLKRKGTVSKKRLKHFVYRRKWQKAVNAIIALIRMGVVLQHPQSGWQESNQPSTAGSKPASQKPTHPTSTSSLSKTTPSRPVEAAECSKRPKIDNKPAADMKQKDRRMSFKAMNNAIFGKFASKRNSPEQLSPETPRPSISTSRRPSLLSRFTKRDDSNHVAGSGSPKPKRKDSLTKQKHKSDRKISREERNLDQTHSSGKPQSKVKASNISTAEVIQDSKPAPGRSSMDSVSKRDIPKQQPDKIESKNEDTSTTEPKTTRPLKPVECKNVAYSTTSSDKTGNQKSLPSPTSNKPATPIQTQKSLQPVPPRPASKKVAPSTGGIAAKIGFFNNIIKDPSS